MSKAFTRESDDLPERSSPLRLPSLLPPGVKNYLTPDGARQLQEELSRLVEFDRPTAAAAPDGSVARQQIETLNQRIQHLQQCLHEAEIVLPPAPPWNQVRFGATVKVRDGSGGESCYRIVGAGETDSDRGWVSWLSPIARALLNARLGQRVHFKFPSGEELLEIMNISYE
jgi:transcription elongation factor GreB